MRLKKTSKKAWLLAAKYMPEHQKILAKKRQKQAQEKQQAETKNKIPNKAKQIDKQNRRRLYLMLKRSFKSEAEMLNQMVKTGASKMFDQTVKIMDKASQKEGYETVLSQPAVENQIFKLLTRLHEQK